MPFAANTPRCKLS